MAGGLPDHLRPAAERLFGDELARAESYAAFLATAGLERGLLGPREADRIWDRHLLNSAVLAELVPAEAGLVDVGSGAGLPGLPLALARADLRVVLLEPMLRRTTFLAEIVERLELSSRVTVLRGRAPEAAPDLPFASDCVVARAVAPLERLVSWTMPLVPRDGVLLALRGRSAEDEVRDAGAAVTALAGSPPELLFVGFDVVDEPVTVVRVVRTRVPEPSGPAARRRRKH